MYKYDINNLTEDFARKLTLYSSQNYFEYENNCFDSDRYTQYVNIIINLDKLNIKQMIDNLNDDYESGITIKHGKLKFEYAEINMIGSKLYKELWGKNSSNTFQSYIDIIENKTDGSLSQWLNISFDNVDIKNNYLDSATDYIIKHQNKEWVKAFQKIDYEKYSWLRPIQGNNIPKKFENYYDLYLWFKENEYDENLYHVGDSIVKTLLQNIILQENYNPHFVGEYRIIKILNECKKDYITCGKILTSDNVGLNCLLLSKFEYSLFGFLNLYNFDSSPREFSKDTNYRQEWQEMLAKQLVEVFFMHFSGLHGHQQVSHIFFKLLNYMTEKYVWGFSNDFYHYKANYTLLLILEKLPQFTIPISQYEKKSLFNLCIKDLITLQLEKFKNLKIFNETSYFLFSYYLKQMDMDKKILNTDYSILINHTTQAIVENLKEIFLNASSDNLTYIKLDFLEKIDFGLIYNLTNDKTEWIQIVNIDSLKIGLNSEDIYVPQIIAKTYFKILLIIFKNKQDADIAQQINKVAIELGINIQYDGLFLDTLKDGRLQDEYFEIINIFDKSLFNELLKALSTQNNLKNLLQLLSYTISEARQKNIKDEIEQAVNDLNDCNMRYYDMWESISYATHNNFRPLASKLINIYKKKITATNYMHFRREFNEIICEKELLDIYYIDDAKEDKFKKLNAYKITFDGKGWGEHSRQVQCENYKDFVRAIIFFEDEPEKTYQILSSLLDKEINSLYLVNMVSAYLHAYENDVNKQKKYEYILNQYDVYNKKLPTERIKSLFEYQVLLYGYKNINETSKILQLYEELPSHYKEHIKEDLPPKIQIFDSIVTVNSKLVVCVESESDIKFLKNINKSIQEYKEIIDLEKEKISFIDLGGSRLKNWIKKHHLEGSNVIELHIYDSDIGAGQNAFQYKKHCQTVNSRGDKSICFLTKKREIENYIHKSLIEEEFKIDMSTIKDWDTEDVPNYIQNKCQQYKEKDIKEILNGKLSKLLTKELLEGTNGFDEIKSWFEKIKELNNL